MVIVAVPLLSVAVGASKLQAAPCSTVLLVLLQVMTGAVVSTMVPLSVQVLLFVRVLGSLIVAVPLLSVAVGASKLQPAPCSTVLLVLLQVMTGAVVSTMVTFWLQVLLLPH